MEFITNQKGGQSLLWNGSRFILNRKMANGTIYWRCCKRSYPARIITFEDQLQQQTDGHNHPANPTELRVEQIKSHLRRQRARQEVTPVPAIYSKKVEAGNVQKGEKLWNRFVNRSLKVAAENCDHAHFWATSVWQIVI